jgi:hypothetical protein
MGTHGSLGLSIRYSTIETKEAAPIGYNGFLFPHEYEVCSTKAVTRVRMRKKMGQLIKVQRPVSSAPFSGLYHLPLLAPTRIWIDAFLSKRIQRVVVDGEASMCSHVTSGVPQGTVLSPTLFLVFINDIADNLHSTARVFADDCVIYRPIHTEKDHQLMQEDLDTLVGWSDIWQMEFNVSKCAIMQTTNKRSKTDFPYKMKGETLEKVDHQPYLGVELSNNLKYNLHIDQTCKKASKVLSFLH